MDKESVKKKIVIMAPGMKAKRVRIPERVETISLKWISDAPFFSEFLLRFSYYETTDIPTMAVNSTRGYINLYFNKEFMDGGPSYKSYKKDNNGKPVILKDENDNPILDDEGNLQVELEEKEYKGLNDIELEAVLVHEIMHLVRLHLDRGQDSEFQLFNVAADMCINEEINGSSGAYQDKLVGLKIGRRTMKLPKDVLSIDLARKDGYDKDLVTEPLYNWLIDKRKEYQKEQEKMQGQGSNGEDSDGSGGKGSKPGEGKENSGEEGSSVTSIKDLFDATYGTNSESHYVLEESDSLAEAAIKDVTDNAIARGIGNISGSFAENLEDLLKPSKINWKNLLRKYVMSHVYGHGNLREHKWSRRNRRGIPLPGTRKLSKRIVVGVDTSGSVDKNQLEQFFIEIEKMVKETSILTVVQWDTEIKNVWKEYKKGDYRKIKIQGRGGTDVQCIFDWVIENKRKGDLLLNFTDGYFYETYNTHNIKNVWCCTSDQKPSGGSVIKIDMED